ncbi:MAG: hypothetical protein ACR5K9_01100 [Wolbachia sp.]
MKMKKLFTLAVLLTSSLASAADDAVANLEGQYYAGLNFGAGWGGGFVMKPSVVFGYHHDKNSKFELEVLSNVKSLKNIGASLLANYRFYPDLDIDPVKLYVSAGLGGYLQIVPFGFGGGEKKGKSNPPAGTTVGTTVSPIYANEGENKENKDNKENKENKDNKGLPLVDKILGSISYKLKVGVDYEITPQIVGTVGVTMGGQLSGLKAKQIPDATLEVGVRYNF